MHAEASEWGEFHTYRPFDTEHSPTEPRQPSVRVDTVAARPPVEVDVPGGERGPATEPQAALTTSSPFYPDGDVSGGERGPATEPQAALTTSSPFYPDGDVSGGERGLFLGRCGNEWKGTTEVERRRGQQRGSCGSCSWTTAAASRSL